MTSQQEKLPPLKSPTKKSPLDKSPPETEKSPSKKIPVGTQYRRRSFMRSIEGGNNLLFGET